MSKVSFEIVKHEDRLIFNSQNIYTLYACDTHQFDDYSKYECTMFDAVHKAQMREKQFPADLAKAFEMGRNLAGQSGI